MEELHVEGLATHGGPESCVASCEGRGEALTGVRAGRAIEPRKEQTGVSTLCKKRKATPLAALSRAAGGPRVVREPGHVRNLRVREPGGPVPARPRGRRAGRRGNAAAVIPGWTGAGSRIGP
jgi:hypothetical protein